MHFLEASVAWRRAWVFAPCGYDPFLQSSADMSDDWLMYQMGGEL